MILLEEPRGQLLHYWCDNKLEFGGTLSMDTDSDSVIQ